MPADVVHRHLGTRLDLEDPDRVGLLDHGEVSGSSAGTLARVSRSPP